MKPHHLCPNLLKDKGMVVIHPHTHHTLPHPHVHTSTHGSPAAQTTPTCTSPSGGVCNVSGERAFKTCYPDLLRGIPNDKVDDLIADLYGNDLLTPAERDQLYDSPGGQKTRQLLTTLEKHICADPKSFYTLLQVLESDHRPLVLKLKDKTSKLT